MFIIAITHNAIWLCLFIPKHRYRLFHYKLISSDVRPSSIGFLCKTTKLDMKDVSCLISFMDSSCPKAQQLLFLSKLFQHRRLSIWPVTEVKSDGQTKRNISLNSSGVWMEYEGCACVPYLVENFMFSKLLHVKLARLQSPIQLLIILTKNENEYK